MGSPRAGGTGKGHQRHRHQPQRAGRQHATNTDRKIPPFARRPHFGHERKTAPDGHCQSAGLSRRPQHAGHAPADGDGLSQHRAARRCAALRRSERHRRRSVGLVRARLCRDQPHPGAHAQQARCRLRPRAQTRALAHRRRTPALVLPCRQPQGTRRADRRSPGPARQCRHHFARSGRTRQAGETAQYERTRRPATAALRRPESRQRAAHQGGAAARRIAPVRPRPPRPHGRHQHQPAGAENRQHVSAKPFQAGGRDGIRAGRPSPSATKQPARQGDLQLHAVRENPARQPAAHPGRQPQPAVRPQQPGAARPRFHRQAAHPRHLSGNRRAPARRGPHAG